MWRLCVVIGWGGVGQSAFCLVESVGGVRAYRNEHGGKMCKCNKTFTLICLSYVSYVGFRRVGAM